MTAPTFLASVFISYAHADKPLARALCEHLNSQGFRVWIDEGELRVGDSLVTVISKALRQVDFLVALVSRNSVNSNWCQRELAWAMTSEVNSDSVTVLPIRIGEIAMPDSLIDKYYLSTSPNDISSIFDDLIQGMRRHLQPGDPFPPRQQRLGTQQPDKQLREREAARRVETLTTRERIILGRMADGLQSGQIAKELNISRNTIPIYLKRILEKLAVDGDAQIDRRVLAIRIWMDAEKYSQ